VEVSSCRGALHILARHPRSKSDFVATELGCRARAELTHSVMLSFRYMRVPAEGLSLETSDPDLRYAPISLQLTLKVFASKDL